MTQTQLQRLFARYNRRYWGGHLPYYQIIVSEKHWGACCNRKSREIHVHPVLFERLDGRALRQTLLHEMAHAATQGIHGKAWWREMRRLNLYFREGRSISKLLQPAARLSKELKRAG